MIQQNTNVTGDLPCMKAFRIKCCVGSADESDRLSLLRLILWKCDHLRAVKCFVYNVSLTLKALLCSFFVCTSQKHTCVELMHRLTGVHNWKSKSKETL